MGVVFGECDPYAQGVKILIFTAVPVELCGFFFIDFRFFRLVRVFSSCILSLRPGHTERDHVREFASRLFLHIVTTPRRRIRERAGDRGPFWEMQNQSRTRTRISVWPGL